MLLNKGNVVKALDDLAREKKPSHGLHRISLDAKFFIGCQM